MSIVTGNTLHLDIILKITGPQLLWANYELHRAIVRERPIYTMVGQRFQNSPFARLGFTGFSSPSEYIILRPT